MGGFTLLEVILSLALATLVVMLIGMAIDAHVTISERGRAKIEQAQLARSVFRLIGDDLRSTILYAPLDFSSIANLNLDADVGGGTTDPSGDAGGNPGGGTGGNSGGGTIPDGAGAAGGNPGGAGGTPGGQSGGQDGGATNSGGAGGATQGGGSTGGNAGGASTGGGASGGTSGGSPSGAGSLLDSATATAEDPPGVYGSADAIEMDISRIPRVDEYETMVQNGRGAAADVPSDVKTVAYYVDGDSASGSPGGPLSGDSQGGLKRRSVDRAVTQYAFANIGNAGLDDSAAVLAPEVTEISFLYYDGSAWTDYWDMVEMGAPPLAVEITITIAAPRIESMFERTMNALGGSSSESTETTTYTQVVYLPTAEGAAGATGSGTTDDTAAADATNTEAAP